MIKLFSKKHTHDAAKRILDDEIYVAAYQSIKNSLIEKLLATKSNQIEERESCYRQIKALEAVSLTLQDFMSEYIINKTEE